VRRKGIGTLCGSVAALLLVLGGVATAQDPAPAGTPAGLSTGPASIPTHWSKYSYPTSIPDGATYYVIVRGDTLWDIAKRYMNNPYLWPQIWEENKYITDAHWIYPGDPLIMPNVALVSDRAGEAGSAIEDTATEESTRTDVVRTTGGGAVYYPLIEETALQCAPYLVSGLEDESLHIIGSEQGESKIAFGEREILYLNKGSNAGVKPGDVYTVHHATYKVKHPESGQTLGTKVEVKGWLRVLLVGEESATTIVEQSCEDIHPGDYLKPFVKMDVPLVPRRPPPDRLTPPSGKIQGFIVDIDHDSFIAGAEQLVTINLGRADGIAPGNEFTIFKVMYPQVPTSRNVLGSLGVVSVQERTSTAKITYSNDHMMQGDRIEMREAYVPPPVTTITESAPGAESVSEARTPAETGTACDLSGFPRNRARLNNVDKACLDDLASRLKTDPRSRVVAIGHADSAERDPDALGTRRADAVKAYLVKERGIDETRIEVRTVGSTRPASETERGTNRRVQVIFVPEGGTAPED
jgi:outer membrane protein OmpA-like peptidoglycan-associated protein